MTIFEQYGKLFSDPEHGEIYFFGTIAICFIIMMLLILVYLGLCRNIEKRRQAIPLPPRQPDPVTITCIQMLEENDRYAAPLDATQSTSPHGLTCKSGRFRGSSNDRQKWLDMQMAQFVRRIGSAEFMSARERSTGGRRGPVGGCVEQRNKEAALSDGVLLPDYESNSRCDLPTPMPVRSGDPPFGMSPMPTRSSRTRTPDTIPTKEAAHRRDGHRDDNSSGGSSPNKMVK